MGLIRFGGHLPKGGYDVQTDGRAPHEPTSAPAIRRRLQSTGVRLVLGEGKTLRSAAGDLDRTETALRERVKRARADRTKGRTGLTSTEREELAQLRKENRQLRVEREILKTQRLLRREEPATRLR